MQKVWLIGMFAAFLSAHASAQHPVVIQKLEEWNSLAPPPSTESLRAQVLQVAAKRYKQNPDCGQSEVEIIETKPATANRYVFSSILAGKMKNAWTVTVRLPACDEAPVRFLTMQSAEGSLRTIRVNRGQSLAWDSLIGDTLPLAKIQAALAVKKSGVDCELGSPSTLGITRLDDRAEEVGPDIYGVRYSGAWAEVWPIEICGRTAEVKVSFRADGDGGAYQNISGADAIVLP